MLKGIPFLHYLLIGVYLFAVSLPASVFIAHYSPPGQKTGWGSGWQAIVNSTAMTQTATASAEPPTPTPMNIPTPIPTSTPIQQPPSQSDSDSDIPWGKAVQVDEVTWRMRVQPDPAMATPQEIFTALNDYRNRHGSPSLQWDDRLASFAQSRANDQNNAGGFDKHAGFTSYLENEENFKVLGFSHLGENAAEHQLSGVHLIEWAYGGDEPHDRQQLDPTWSHVGAGVAGTMSVLIFGKGGI